MWAKMVDFDLEYCRKMLGFDDDLLIELCAHILVGYLQRHIWSSSDQLR